MSDQDAVNAVAMARAIEPIAVASWPARETLFLDGWLLRFTNGFTHRGNSVATVSFAGDDALAAVDRVETEYQKRALLPMFQVASAVEPSDLGKKLLLRGYEVITPTLVLVGEPAAVRDHLPSPGDARVSREPDGGFALLVLEGSRSVDDGRERMDILARIGADRICVTLEERGQAVACGMGALIGGHVGINMMRTTPASRRKGHARRVLGTIAEWACNKGASRLYLSVERENAPAVALYRGASFEPGYSYRYYRKRS